MYRLLICTMAICMLFLSGCASTSAPATPKDELPTLAGTWTIRMVHSGGIMGLSRSIEVSSEGMYTVTDERAGGTKKGRLSEEELKRLAQLVSSVQYSPPTGPSGCADCFIYDIEISGAGKPFTARADDVTLSASGLEPLVSALGAIMDRELN